MENFFRVQNCIEKYVLCHTNYAHMKFRFWWARNLRCFRRFATVSGKPLHGIKLLRKRTFYIRLMAWDSRFNGFEILEVFDVLLACLAISLEFGSSPSLIMLLLLKIQVNKAFEKKEKKKRCVLKTTRQKWKRFEEMFVRFLNYHRLNS